MGGYPQQMQTPYRREVIQAPETGQVLGVRCHYRGKGPAKTYRWRTRARHLAKGNVVIPPMWGRNDTFDPDTIGVGKKGFGPVSFTYKSQPKGWVYAQLWLEDNKESKGHPEI